MKYNLPVILLKGTVLIPNQEMKFEFEDDISKSIIEEAELFHDNQILIVTKISQDNNLLINELPKVGTFSKIENKIELPNGKIRVTIKGITRALVIDYLNPNKEVLESFISIPQEKKVSDEIEKGFITKLNIELNNYIEKLPSESNSILSTINKINDLSKLTDIIVEFLSLDNSRKLEYLFEFDALKRVEMLLNDMYKKEQLFSIENSINKKVKKELDNDEKQFFIKKKIKQLQSELGQKTKIEDEINSFKERVESLDSHQIIKDKILHEIDRYQNMSNISPEYEKTRCYIDYMLSLPWNYKTNDIDNLSQIKDNLDNRHYGIQDVKTRIIEYLAVKKQSSNINSPIICLVGAPGVGKTTLAYSIAKSIGRNFVKISLGGVDDEAFIKGHIRTYIGSMPGKIIDGIKRAKSSNPVFLIDEIDKMSSNHKGDPKSALLEVLDYNQNKYFKDNYLEEEYDLSNVIFIATANDVTNIPEALRDRLEIINIDGYTPLEKISITKNYLIPNICKKHGIKNIKISDENIKNIINFYTKESGLRQLERMVSKIVRKIVTDKILNNKKITYTVNDIEKYLGKKLYEVENVISEIGVVNSMAYTQCGGDIIPIEVNYYNGNGKIIFTGSIGEVMMESAKIALSYIKANYKKYNINYDVFNSDIHINIPNISIKKEGPSAGIAITTALISALSNLKVNNNLAMTGEITLRGNILKIGRLKEKIIGAYINNINTIFIPYSNIEDISAIPYEIKEKMNIIPVKKYDDIYDYLKGDLNE